MVTRIPGWPWLLRCCGVLPGSCLAPACHGGLRWEGEGAEEAQDQRFSFLQPKTIWGPKLCWDGLGEDASEAEQNAVPSWGRHSGRGDGVWLGHLAECWAQNRCCSWMPSLTGSCWSYLKWDPAFPRSQGITRFDWGLILKTDTKSYEHDFPYVWWNKI